MNLGLYAQCALCRAALQSSGQRGLILGLSLSILFVLAVSTLLLGGIAYLVYKASRNKGPGPHAPR